MRLTRREFFKVINRVLAATGLAAVLGPVVAYFYPPDLQETPSEPVLVAPKSEFGVGQSRTVAFGRYPALVIHTTTGLKAYSAVCTHFACICKWNPDSEKIVCPCHDGFFDPTDGSVISGPPPKGLKPLQTVIKDGDIYVSAGDES